MNAAFARAQLLAGDLLRVEWDTDDKGVTSAHPIFPPVKEIFIGGAASLIVFAALWKYAVPAMKQAMHDRSDRIQSVIDGASEAKTDADTQAGEFRTALGYIDAERQRLFAEAEAQAEAILTDGRIRLDAEVAELHERAEADVSSAAGRSSDALRADIGSAASASIDRVVADTLDDAAQQELIEAFIQRVGASTGATS